MKIVRLIIIINPIQMKLFITIIICSIIAVSASAQEHHDEPRYGGVVEEADGYHFGMVKSGDQLTIYFFEAAGTSSIQYNGIEAEFTFAKKSAEKAFLVKSDKGYFVTSVPASSIFEYCTVLLNIDGRNVSIVFRNPDLSRKKKHGHSH